MARASNTRRVMIAAAGLTLSAVMIGCGRARGERAARTDSAAIVVDSATPTYDTDAAKSPDNAANPAAPAERSPSLEATDPAVSVTTTTPAPRRTRAARRSYEVSPTPETDVSARAEANQDRTSVRADVNDRSDFSVRTDTRSTEERLEPGNRTDLEVSADPNRPAAAPGARLDSAGNPVAAVEVTTAATTVCFVNDAKLGFEYPSARTDAADARVEPMPGDEGAKTPSAIRDSNVVVDQAMAPTDAARVTVRTETPAQPEVRDNAAASVDAAPADERRVVPCMMSGEKKGNAAGAFLNDAQVGHAALIANTIDSAVSAAAVIRATNTTVREYAEMMVRDHTAGNQRLSTVFERLRVSPADNELSTGLLRDVLAFSETVPAPSTATTPVTQGATQPGYRAPNAAAAPAPNPVDRDTLHLNNRFVAAANMQPWSSLLAGLSGRSDSVSANVQAARSAGMPARPDAAMGANVTSQPTATATPATTDFDRKYIDYQVNFHQKVLEGLDTRLIPWAGPELRAVLEETRPRVVSHLERAREIQRTMNTTPAPN